MPDQPLPRLALALKLLRIAAGWTMAQLAQALGVSESLLSRYERGDKPLLRGQLDTLIVPLGYLPEAVDVLLTALALIFREHSAVVLPRSSVTLTPEEWRRMDRAAMAAGWTASSVAADAVRAVWAKGLEEQKADAETRRAESLFRGLISLAGEDRRTLIEACPKAWSWALAVRLCEASLKKASNDAAEALELAELAVSIAERVPGEEGRRRRLLGYCWAHVANARRVANHLAAADHAFATAWDLWRKGADRESESKGLEEWLLPALEASLRRDQRRLPEALALLEQARLSPGGTAPTAELATLLNQATVLSLMGHTERSLAAMAAAAQLCDAAGDRRSLLVLRFNIAEDLLKLNRLEETEQMLPQIRELTIGQANELDLIRLGWLAARVAAAGNRTSEAVAGLEQVRQDFTSRSMPYDAALSGLDLAVLWLKEGHTGEVQKLALAMRWIFTAEGVAREALAALRLFCDAARQEAATVDLARQVISTIEEVRRSASSKGGGRA